MRIKEHVIPVLKDAVDDHPDGHILVFLPGSAEITQAIKAFNPPNHVDVFPLYGSLPPEEQQKVFEYNEEGGNRRMVVFCTNIAEVRFLNLLDCLHHFSETTTSCTRC